jgi:Family of unknown function (DUF5763)
MRVSGIQAQRDRETQLYRGEMRGAMERFLTVNGFSGSMPGPRDNQALNAGPALSTNPQFGIEPAPYGVETRIRSSRAPQSDQGPCLYFGPQGQRCSRRAVSNGFCASHLPAQPRPPGQPGRVAAPGMRQKSRIVAVVLFAVAMLQSFWPAISDIIREIIRWLHAH